jgi:hypothetical protein
MSEDLVEIGLDGRAVAVPRDVVHAIAAAAAARAGVSRRHRDLSLHLNRSLESGRVNLEQADVRTLVAVLEEEYDRFGPAGAELLRAAA